APPPSTFSPWSDGHFVYITPIPYFPCVGLVVLNFRNVKSIYHTKQKQHLQTYQMTTKAKEKLN
ncbi:hypothetical protein, partial [Bacillus cereus]|uniref:hypothetical protein n=1 Tax=Bacillus cereus TaxID=1396 RepID=UPI001A7E9227